MSDQTPMQRLLGPGHASRRGLPSWCSSNPHVLRAVFATARSGTAPVLVEATCNQVNQDGGYTGLTPEGFRDYAMDLAAECGLDASRLRLGGDHLGPNPWKALPADEALMKACTLVEQFAEAGFRKIHLDASMPCADDGELDDETIADRAALLCEFSEAAATGEPPVYVIGTEVPAPGGVTEGHDELAVTPAEHVERTLATHRRAFEARGLQAAWQRVAAIVVQPGVEFTNRSIIEFDPAGAGELAGALAAHDGLVYEAHSTDYQPEACLRGLVDHGFAFLKVGPELTFAFREAVQALTHIAAHLPGARGADPIAAVLAEMARDPTHWQGHYTDPDERAYEQLFSYSDRIRYYWGREPVAAALEDLVRDVEPARRRWPLLHQYLPDLDAGRLADADEGLAEKVIREKVGAVVRRYQGACD